VYSLPNDFVQHGFGYRLPQVEKVRPGDSSSDDNRSRKFWTVYLFGLSRESSSSQRIGVATGALGRARVEYEATAVAPRWLRK